MKIFNKILRQNIGITVLVIILGIVVAAMFSGAALTLGGLLGSVDEGNPGDFSGIIRTTLIIIAAYVATAIMFAIHGVAKSYYIYAMSNDLRLEITEKVVNTPFLNFNAKNSGSYISWYTTDVREIVALGVEAYVGLYSSFATALFAFLSIAFLNIGMGFITLGLLFLTVIIPQIFNPMLYKAQKNLTESNETLSEDIREAITGYNVFYISDKIAEFKKIVTKASVKREKVFRRYNKTKAYVGSVSIIMSVIAQVGLMVISVFYAASGKIEIGQIFAVSALSGIIFNNVPDFVRTLISFKSVRPILEKYEYEEIPDGKNIIENLGNIRLEDISLKYGEKQIFENFDFEIDTSKKYVIIGESGSGKTTLLKLLLGLISPDCGGLYIDGEDISEIQRKSYFSKFAYIDQNVFLFKGSIRDNITLWKSGITDEQLNEIIKKVQLESFVNSREDGLDSYLSEAGKNISGGEKQRIALARALVNKIKLVIIDESTSQLDESTAKAIETMLVEQEDFGVIMVSHHVSDSIASRFDEVVELPIVA